MSAKRDLFTDLKARILGLVPEVKTVKRWNNQIEPENDDREDPIKYPAVYIQFTQILWQQFQGGIQKGDITVTIHYVPEKYDTENEDFYTELDKVHIAVQGYQEDYFTPLTRIEEREDDDHDVRIDYQSDYNTLISDCSTDNRNDLTETTATLNLQVDLDIDNDVIRTGDGKV